jgi:hypothetical protein
MLQSVNKLSTEPALHLCGPLDKNAAMKSANTTAIQKMILPHIPESNHSTNPAARVRAIFIDMVLSDSEMTPDAFSLLGEGVRAQRINRIQRLRGVSKRHLGGCLKCIQEIKAGTASLNR